MGAFHAYDIRGIWNKDFNKEEVYSIGFYLPSLLNTNKILVGRDARVSSPEIFEALTAGITDAGADVYNIGLSTTPMVYFGTAKHGFKASVQITASHNSKEYNGLKVSAEGAMPIGYDNGLGELEKMIKTQPNPTALKGKIHDFEIKDQYIAFLKSYKGNYSNLKMSIDLSNGMAALLIKDLIDNAIYVCDKLDGTFPEHDPNPLVQSNLKILQNTVKENSSDIGIIFDGDADRVMFVDENGAFISPDLMIAVLGHYFLERKGLKGNVLQDIRTSKAVGEYLTPMGATMNTWRVGRAFAARKLKEINGVFGGELAGHYYFKDFFYSDSGILACLIILDVIAEMKNKGITVSKLISKIALYKNSGEINYKIAQKAEAMDAVCKHFESEEKPVAKYDFDGFRLGFPEWWFNIRPSNTEPLLRFIAEARSEDVLKEKVAAAEKIINSFK